MAQRSQFWNTSGVGDGSAGGYTLDNWRDLFFSAFGDGVTLEGSQLAVSGTASPLSVAAGTAFVYGLYYENDSALSLPVTTPAATTGGHVVLEANWSAQTVRAKVVLSASGVTTPPAVVVTPGTTYQIRLASFTVTATGVITLTDARPFIQFNTNHVRRAGDVIPGDVGFTFNIDPALVPTLDGSRNARVAYNRSGGAGEVDLVAAGGTAASTFRAYRRNNDGTLVQHFEVTPTALIGPIGTVAQLSHRRGGSSTNWSTPGTTAYVVTGAIREQVAMFTISIPAGQVSSLATLTFPNAFSSPPVVLVTAQEESTSDTEQGPIASLGAVTATTAQIRVSRRNPANTSVIAQVGVHVIAKGVA